MTKKEFLSGLRTALSFKVGAAVVEENIRYYEEYIATQVRMGRKESEVVEELGDPRLLARSIADASKNVGDEHGQNQESYYGDAHYDTEDVKKERYGKNFTAKILGLPAWCLKLIGIVVAVLLVYVIISFLSFLAPILIPVILVLTIVRWFGKE